MTQRTIIFLLLCNEINQITLHIYDFCIVKSIKKIAKMHSEADIYDSVNII